MNAKIDNAANTANDTRHPGRGTRMTSAAVRRGPQLPTRHCLRAPARGRRVLREDESGRVSDDQREEQRVRHPANGSFSTATTANAGGVGPLTTALRTA